MPRRSKREERLFEGLVVTLEHLPEDQVVKIDQVRFGWARRRVVEGRHLERGREVVTPMSVWDLWFDGPPEDASAEPDIHEASPYPAAERILAYND